MLARLMLAVVVSGAVLVPMLELMAADSNRQIPRKQRLRSLLTKFSRKKIKIGGRLRDEQLQPMVGVLVYADISRCSLALPLTADTARKPCADERVVTVTDSDGRYQLRVTFERAHKYLHVRFRIAQAGDQDVVVPMASVDHMLGRMEAGSYYRLNREYQRILAGEPRDLIYASRQVALDAEQLSSPWQQENRRRIGIALASNLHTILADGKPQKGKQKEVVTVSSCTHHTLHRDTWRDTQPPQRLVDFRFLFPANGIGAEQVASATDLDCSASPPPPKIVDL